MKFVETAIPVASASFRFTATTTTSAFISAGQSVSTTIDMTAPELKGFVPYVVFVPSGWTSAKMSLNISLDGANWFAFHLYDKDFVTKTIAPLDALVDPQYLLRGIPYFQIVSGTSSAPTTQTNDVELKVLCGTI